MCNKCRKFWDDLSGTAWGNAKSPTYCKQYKWKEEISKADKGEGTENSPMNQNGRKGLLFRRTFEEWMARCKMHDLHKQASQAMGMSK